MSTLLVAGDNVVKGLAEIKKVGFGFDYQSPT